MKAWLLAIRIRIFSTSDLGLRIQMRYKGGDRI